MTEGHEPKPREILNLSQMCKELHISVAMGSKLLRTPNGQGKLPIPHVRIGRKILIRREDLERYKAACTVTDEASLRANLDGRRWHQPRGG